MAEHDRAAVAVGGEQLVTPVDDRLIGRGVVLKLITTKLSAGAEQVVPVVVVRS
jgi:hypothetical protein